MSSYSQDLARARAYLEGDATTEKQLYRELRRIIHFLIGELEKSGAVFQDRQDAVSAAIFHTMVRNDRHVLRSYKGDCKLTTYLYRVVRNFLVDLLRTERRQAFVDLSEATDEATVAPADGATASLAAAVLEHIDQEEPVHRLIKLSRWVDEQNYDQIQERVEQEMGQSVTRHHIAYVLHKNRKALKEKLKNFRR